MFELRTVIGEFLLSKYNLFTEYFLARVAYLDDIFSALCAVNASLQGRDTNMFEACDKLSAFSEKLKLWKRRVQRGQLEHFHNHKNFIEAESIEYCHATTGPGHNWSPLAITGPAIWEASYRRLELFSGTLLNIYLTS